MKEIEKLNEAFKVFSAASEVLQRYYKTLKDEVSRLNNELQKKNKELEETLETLRSVVNCIKDALFVVSNDGSIIMMNERARDIKDHIQPDRLCNTSYDGKEFLVNKNNDRRYFLVSLSEIKTGGIPTGYILMLKDITEKKLQEFEKERNKRLIAMGEMMAGIVHEMRNPLCSIELYASMLHRELEGTELESLARGVSTGVRSVNNILSNMLYFAKPRKPNKQPVQIEAIIDESLSLIGPVAESRNITVKKHIDRCNILVDEGLIKQVLMNLFLNAIQAMKSGGTLTIKTERSHNHFLINIIDTGTGIGDEVLERIFDPFFTTRDDGTGLGLSISLKIMQSHGGTINVRSEPGRGSCFTLLFPKESIQEVISDGAHTCCG